MTNLEQKTQVDKYTQACKSCLGEGDELRTIYEDEICRGVLRVDNQVWLGRYIVLPRKHYNPLDFWLDAATMTHVMKVYVAVTKAIILAFGANCVQQAQLGGLTQDENGKPTMDQSYQHAHIHGIPRYEHAPTFLGKSWPDPQCVNGALTALNIDTKAGLKVVVPSAAEIAAIVEQIKLSLHV